MPRLFLCDDAPGYRRLLKEVFREEEDLEIVGEAGDGQECLEAIAAANPDVVVLDLNMPRMSGREALPRLRALAPTVDVLVLSSDAHVEVEQEMLDLGAAGYLHKPMDVFSLAGAMREKVRSLDRRRGPRAA